MHCWNVELAGILGYGGSAAEGSSAARMGLVFFLLGFVFAGAWGFLKRRRVP
jgi:hypothetical protein